MTCHHQNLGSASLVEANFPCGTTNQKHYPDIISMEFLRSFLNVIWQVVSQVVRCFLGLEGGGPDKFLLSRFL